MGSHQIESNKEIADKEWIKGFIDKLSPDERDYALECLNTDSSESVKEEIDLDALREAKEDENEPMEIAEMKSKEDELDEYA